nr:hypothetical protein [candidate division Zixibacteria bacterium]
MQNDYMNDEVLYKYLAGELSASEEDDLCRRLASDKCLKETFDIIRELHSEGSGTDWSQIRVSALELARRVFNDYRRSLKEKTFSYGINVYDSKVLPLPQGVRPARIDNRRLTYKVGRFDLDISLYPVTTDSYELIGQITGSEESRVTGVKLKSKKAVIESEADRYNLFRFARIPIGNYTLNLMSGDKKIGAVTFEL